MASSFAPADPASLSELYGICMEAFKKLLLTLSEENCRVVHLEQVYVPAILDEYGRAKIWGDQSKADLPARARGSLDDTLRHDDDLKKLVRGVFLRLRALLIQATSIADRKRDPLAESDYDSVSSVSLDSSDSDSDSDSDDKAPRRTMPKIRLLVQQIVGQIRSLYDLSSLLRRPKVFDKYIRSVNRKAEKAASTGSDTLPLSAGFQVSDESHVVEKMTQWRGLTKADLGVNFEEEVVSPGDTGIGLASDGVEDILWFCQRLARANTRRREQLQYWISHPYDPQGDTPTITQAPAQPVALVVPAPVGEMEELRSQTSTLKPPEFTFPRPGPKSTFSKLSFSTAAVSLVHDTKTNIRPRTVYAPTAVGKGRSNSVPHPPKPKDGSDTFPCPYCGITLGYGEMENRQTWQRHVFRDLRPYVCTFEDCHNAGKLYVSRHDWAHHELQVHRREFVCNKCDKRSQTRQEASAHLREHGDSILPSQLSVILDLAERQVDISLSQKEPCLVCGEELSLKALQNHLASHMEDIALFVLPSAEDDEDTGDSNASIQVKNLGSKGKAGDDGSETSSLGFSAAGDNDQGSLTLAEILAKEEVAYDAVSNMKAELEQYRQEQSQEQDDAYDTRLKILSAIKQKMVGSQDLQADVQMTIDCVEREIPRLAIYDAEGKSQGGQRQSQEDAELEEPDAESRSDSIARKIQTLKKVQADAQVEIDEARNDAVKLTRELPLLPSEEAERALLDLKEKYLGTGEQKDDSAKVAAPSDIPKSPPPSTIPKPPPPSTGVSYAAWMAAARDTHESYGLCDLCGYQPRGNPMKSKEDIMKHKEMEHSNKPRHAGYDIMSHVDGYLFPLDLQHDHCRVMRRVSHCAQFEAKRGFRRHYTRTSPSCLIGRGPDCDIVLPDAMISQRHCTISMRKTGESKPFMHDTTLPVTLNDLSTNGTHVNMELVGTDSSRELHDGDKITLPGGFGFIFKAPLSSSTPAFDDLYTIMGEICAPMFGLPRMPDDSQPHSDNQQIAQNIERQLENLVERLEGQLYVKGDSGSKYVDDTPPYRPYRTTRLVSCVQKSTHRRYAVKKITKSAEPGTIGGKMSLQSHERMEKGIPLRSHERMEIGILMRVKHPQILCLWDTFNNSDAAYLVFDAEPKQTLSSIINKTGRVAERKGRGVLQQVFHAVQYLHGHDIVHRDINPDNVVSVDGGTRFKLTNFECAEFTKGGVFHTRGSIRHFVAPELFKPTKPLHYTNSVDIWSLGLTLYTCLAGFESLYTTMLFDVSTSGFSDLMESHLKSVLPKPTYSAIAFVKSMTEFEPERRLTIDECVFHPWMLQDDNSADEVDSDDEAELAELVRWKRELNMRQRIRQEGKPVKRTTAERGASDDEDLKVRYQEG